MSIQPAQFDGKDIRCVYDEKTEVWWFSVIDVVQALTDSANARDYWFKMKQRVQLEDGAELSTFCRQLKMLAADGKQRLTDAASAESLLRIIQSIPSPKVEPIKLWLAKVGYERMQEMSDLALSLNRARETWQKHGRSEKWIQQRMTGQETRNKPVLSLAAEGLTDYWANHDIKQGEEFAILTNLIHQEWAGVSVKAHKTMKGLKTQNLRDHMSEAELIGHSFFLDRVLIMAARTPSTCIQTSFKSMCYRIAMRKNFLDRVLIAAGQLDMIDCSPNDVA